MYRHWIRFAPPNRRFVLCCIVLYIQTGNKCELAGQRESESIPGTIKWNGLIVLLCLVPSCEAWRVLTIVQHLSSPHVWAVKVVDRTSTDADTAGAATTIIAVSAEPRSKGLARLLRGTDFSLQLGGALVDHLQLWQVRVQDPDDLGNL